MKYKDNWVETQQRFTAWWRGEKMDRPLLNIMARRQEPLEALEAVEPPRSAEEKHIDPVRLVKEQRNYCRTRIFLAESFPFLDINIGPGSMATYLGSEPVFDDNTVWYQECIRDWAQWGEFHFNPENVWWKRHVEILQKARELSGDDFCVAIPDIQENIDILAALRGPQAFCYDLIDEPDLMRKHIKRLDELYFDYYDPMHEIVKLNDGSSCYTAFSIWGPGKTAKVQCDFSALMSPSQFSDFAVPSITSQCKQLDCSLYHLDGVDATRHLDALMGIRELNALQWTPGAGKPDGGSDQWYPIYEKVRKAGKSLWISIETGTPQEKMEKAQRLVKTFGHQGLYLLFYTMEEQDARRLLGTAEDSWN